MNKQYRYISTLSITLLCQANPFFAMKMTRIEITEFPDSFFLSCSENSENKEKSAHTNKKKLKKSKKLKRSKQSKEKINIEEINLTKILYEDIFFFHNVPSILHNDLMITPMHYAIIQDNLPIIKKFMHKLKQPYNTWISRNHYQTCHKKGASSFCYLQVARELNQDTICTYFLQEQDLPEICTLAGAIKIHDITHIQAHTPQKNISLEKQKIIKSTLIQNINNLFDANKPITDSSGNCLYKDNEKILFLHDRFDAISIILSKYKIEEVKKNLWNIFFSYHKKLFSKELSIYKDNLSQDFILNFDEKKDLLKHYFELLFTNTLLPKSPQNNFARKILSLFYAHYFPYSKIELPLKGMGYELPTDILKIYIAAAADKLHEIPRQNNNIPNFLHQACQKEDYILVKLITHHETLNINQSNDQGESAIDIIFEKMKDNLYKHTNNEQKNQNKTLLKIFARLIEKKSDFSDSMIDFIECIETECIESDYLLTIIHQIKKLIDSKKPPQQNIIEGTISLSFV